MGFRITLLSIPSHSSGAVLHRLGLQTGNEPDVENEAPLSGAASGENYLVWVNDDWHTMSDDKLRNASHHGEIVMLRANETIMNSEVARFDAGTKTWSLAHDCTKGKDHLAVTGNPPPIWQEIRDGLLAEAAADGDKEVDFVYDAPVALFKNLTGFRYDEVHELPFVALRSEHAAKPKKPFWKFWS